MKSCATSSWAEWSHASIPVRTKGVATVIPDDLNRFDRRADFFAEVCNELSLPLATVVSNTEGFIRSIIALPNEVDRIHMGMYIEKGSTESYLRCYLQTTGGLSAYEAWRVAKEVLTWVINAGIPLTYPQRKT
jgi:hypothetical protein